MAGLSFDSKSSNSAFLSAGIFSADSIADLVFSMCSSVIHALPLTFVISLCDLRTRWNGTRLETTCNFRKSSPTRTEKQFANNLVGRTFPSKSKQSLPTFEARGDLTGKTECQVFLRSDPALPLGCTSE